MIMIMMMMMMMIVIAIMLILNKQLLEELSTYCPPLSSNMTRTAKRTPRKILGRGKVFIDIFPNNERGIHRQTHRLSFHIRPTA
jgi:hypothetical protein